MTKRKEISITLISILIIMLLMYSIVFLFTNRAEIFAEGLDDLSENTMVNFNQLVNITSSSNSNISYNNSCSITINANTTSMEYLTLTDFTFKANEIYYIYISNSFNVWNCFGWGGSAIKYVKSSSIYTPTDTYNINRFYIYSGETAKTTSINVINLTQMFGEIASEITLEQCENYFISSYYPYNEGTTMPFSKGYLQGYTEGQQDLYDTLTVTYNNDILGTISYAANIEGFSSSIGYNNTTSTYLVEGLAGIHFGDYLTTTINFTAKYWSGGNNMSSLYVVFFKYDGSNLIPLTIQQVGPRGDFENGSGNYDGSSEFSFNINNVDTIYFGMFNSSTNFTSSTNVTMYCYSAAMQLNTINVAALTNAAYSRGYQTATEFYTTEGTTGYNTIYNIGYRAALTDANASVNAMQVVSAAFTGVGDILQIEVLPGFPLGAFVLVPLMLGLIFFVIKVAKGGS